jgi:hypothetical protein
MFAEGKHVLRERSQLLKVFGVRCGVVWCGVVSVTLFGR